MDNKVKNVLLLVLVIGLVGMTSAYALLSSSFQINSTARVTGATWDVHLENLQGPSYTPATGYKASGAAVVQNGEGAKIATSTTITGINAVFNAPDESVSYTFDVVNNGTLPALLQNYVIASNSGDHTFTCTGATGENADTINAAICNKITYTLKQGNTDITNGRTLLAKSGATATKETWTLTISLANMENNEWPADDITVSNMNIAFDFVQTESN